MVRWNNLSELHGASTFARCSNSSFDAYITNRRLQKKASIFRSESDHTLRRRRYKIYIIPESAKIKPKSGWCVCVCVLTMEECICMNIRVARSLACSLCGVISFSERQLCCWQKGRAYLLPLGEEEKVCSLQNYQNSDICLSAVITRVMNLRAGSWKMPQLYLAALDAKSWLSGGGRREQ